MDWCGAGSVAKSEKLRASASTAIHCGTAAPWRIVTALEPIFLHSARVGITLVSTSLQRTAPHALDRRASRWSLNPQRELWRRRLCSSNGPTECDQQQGNEGLNSSVSQMYCASLYFEQRFILNLRPFALTPSETLLFDSSPRIGWCHLSRTGRKGRSGCPGARIRGHEVIICHGEDFPASGIDGQHKFLLLAVPF